MRTHNICFGGEIRKYEYFSVKEKKKMPYLEVCYLTDKENN